MISFATGKRPSGLTMQPEDRESPDNIQIPSNKASSFRSPSVDSYDPIYYSICVTSEVQYVSLCSSVAQFIPNWISSETL